LPRALRRLARLVLEALPIQAACRLLAGRRASGLAVLLCFDCEPDARALDRASPGPWPSFEEIVRRAAPLRERLAALSGAPVGFSWFVRIDPQVAEVWGSPGWAADRYRDELDALHRLGDDVGLHTHVWRWDAGAGEWLIDFREEWGVHCLGVGLESFEQALGRPCRAHRAGDRALNGSMLALLAERGVEVDLTVEPDLDRSRIVPEGERGAGRLPDFRGLPREPYTSSPAAFPEPDPGAGSGPLLVPVAGVNRSTSWGRSLLLGTHPSLFAVRLLVELLRGRRTPVLCEVLRTDPVDLAAWGPVVANLEHLARHRGVRFVPATAVARGTRPDGRAPGPSPARSPRRRSRQAAAS
jgi:hypothetical protein